MSAGKCKRVAATSSSDDDSPRSDDTSVTTATEPSSPTPAHEYDVSSPGSSSTLSGGASSVSHAPGFSHSSQQQTLRRSRVKKKKADVNVRVGAGILCCHSEQTNTQLEPSRLAKHHVTPRSKPAREPVPMRMRALPQSIWQEPNIPHYVSPATVYPILPPLITREGDDITDLRPVTPPEEQEDSSERCRDKMTSRAIAMNAHALMEHRPPLERTITVANPDLLMQLFDVVDSGRGKVAPSLNSQLRRTRSKKVVIASSHKSSLLSGHDPHMVDNIAEKLFPQLTLERPALGGAGRHAGATLNCSTAIVNLRPLTIGDKTVMLPSLSVDQNYPQMLSEVVANI